MISRVLAAPEELNLATRLRHDVFITDSTNTQHVLANLVHKSFICAQTVCAYAVTTALRARYFKHMGVVFKELARHDSSIDSVIVIQVDGKKTDWSHILERST